MTIFPDASPLPSFLQADQVMTDPDALALQVLLLTQELALVRHRMAAMAAAMDALAAILRLPSSDPLEFPSE